MIHRVQTIDSHTGGEPTRVVIAGGPDLRLGNLADRFARFKSEHDSFRSAVVKEPRGSEVIVGALLLEPDDVTCCAALIFFNNQGFLGMCGHGTIGAVETLKHLGRLSAGKHRIQTPAGIVTAELLDNGQVAVQNVGSYRLRKDVELTIPGATKIGSGKICGEIAYGGNWFFLVKSDVGPITVDRAGELTGLAWQVRHALERANITGANGAEIDHIEFFCAPHDAENDSRNFVLCPGGAYDRSPCGTGTSAKLACLAADGKLGPGEIWHQESVIGSLFSCSYTWADASDQKIVPTIRGRAFVTGEATLLLDPEDPFCMGIRG